MGKRGRPPYPDILTPREWEVLALLRLELSNPEIAERLGISRDGAKYHVSQILGKLGLESREQAAHWKYEDAQPWWATAFAPFLPAWRKRSSMLGSVAGAATRLIAGVVLAATLGGLALLGLLLYLQNDDGVSVSASQLLYWDAEGSLWLVDADGSRRTFAKSVECESSRPHWSPTGETLICGQSDGSVVFLDGEGEVLGELTMQDMWLMHWSPTGQHVLFATREGTEEEPEYELHIADRAGNEVV
ncbi:MAG: helix-turn-helix transcriptional regulator, partial [Chloroflexi bacterium]|nr:helix-turn-helix transcriptional regulator [Chloroflexota bacterium]